MTESIFENGDISLDIIISVSARKLQYLENLIKIVPKKHHNIIKNIIADMDNAVFLTSYEKQNGKLQNTEKIELNGNMISKTFKKQFKKKYPNHSKVLNVK